VTLPGCALLFPGLLAKSSSWRLSLSKPDLSIGEVCRHSEI